MVGGFLTRFAAVAAANPHPRSAAAAGAAAAAARIANGSDASSSALSSSSSVASSGDAPGASPAPSSGVTLQIEYCEECGYRSWAEAFRDVLNSTPMTSNSTSSMASASSSSSRPPPRVVLKRVRAVGAFEVSLLAPSSVVPLWSKLGTGQPATFEGVAAVAQLAAAEAARADAERRRRET